MLTLSLQNYAIENRKLFSFNALRMPVLSLKYYVYSNYSKK